MTDFQFNVCLILVLILNLATAFGVWLCFRRTHAKGFLFLGAVTILWPWFDQATELLRKLFLEQVLRGQKAWLFPFSLMTNGGSDRVDTGWGEWEMFPGEFLTKFNMAKELLLYLLLATAFALLARSFKKAKDQQAKSTPA